MIPSIDKTLHYLNSVSKENKHIEFSGVPYDLTTTEEFYIQPSTFCKDECLSCGQCCRNYDTIMFPTDYDEIKRRADEGQEPYQFYLDNCQEFTLSIEGKEYKYFSVPPMTAKDNHDIWCDGHKVLNCRWIFIKDGLKLCKIHEYRCITCGFPHMELYQNHEGYRGYLGHKQFGRNHQLGCKVDIRRPLDKATLDDNIYWLTRLNTVADYLEVKTYLPEILSTLYSIDIDHVPEKAIVLTKTRTKKLFNLGRVQGV